jgi:hypothetical protein
LEHKPFVPSAEWQEVPEGVVMPNGGTFRMNLQTGKNEARWVKTEDTEKVEDAELNKGLRQMEKDLNKALFGNR